MLQPDLHRWYSGLRIDLRPGVRHPGGTRFGNRTEKIRYGQTISAADNAGTVSLLEGLDGDAG